MADALEVIRSRQSIRSFSPRPFPGADLAQIAEAGILAPNARNQQKWHFTVIESADRLRPMSKTVKEQMLASGLDFLVERARTPGYDPLHGATALIMVSGDDNAPFIQLDCGAAAQNIALAAEALGYGSCVMVMPGRLFAADRDGRLARELGIPEGYSHVISVALGYVEGERPPRRERNHDVFTYVK